jgi:hypothetical protein
MRSHEPRARTHKTAEERRDETREGVILFALLLAQGDRRLPLGDFVHGLLVLVVPVPLFVVVGVVVRQEVLLFFQDDTGHGRAQGFGLCARDRCADRRDAQERRSG